MYMMLDQNSKKQNRCLLAVEGSQSSIWDWDVEGAVISVSPVWWTFVGSSNKKDSLTFEEWIGGIFPADRDMIQGEIKKILTGSDARFQLECRYSQENGTFVWILVQGQILRNNSYKPLRLIGICFDITDQKEVGERAEFLAYYDTLTMLPNRMYLKNQITRSLMRISRDSGYGFSLLFLDLDGFKEVNDTYGHRTGDSLLTMVAGRFKESVRSIDVVARVGGDEFIILLDGIVDHADIKYITNRIIKSIQKKFIVDKNVIYISVSIGIETDIKAEDLPDDIMQKADRAMYFAKSSGKGKYKFFDDSLVRKSQHRWFLGNELHKALDNNEIEIFYQPIFNLKSGTLNSLEVLTRWKHRKKGLILPNEFIPVAEETGVITAITEWILEETSKHIIMLSTEREKAFENLFFSVNVSSRDFMVKKGLNGLVKGILSRTGLHPSQLAIEVTEGSIIKNYESAISQLTELRNMGIHIELDDFGTGYSSLSYVSSFPLDIIKIDKSFIDHMHMDSVSYNLVKSIIDLSHNIDLTVIAEGVEVRDQLDKLYELGCDNVQGYLYSKPFPSADITEYLDKLPIKTNM